MPHFRCTSCRERVYSPVVIGAGDCPNCGGDVVFDLHGSPGGGDPEDAAPPAGRRDDASRLGRVLRRLRRR